MNWTKAIDLVKTSRSRFELCDGNGNFCALGAIGYAALGDVFLAEADINDSYGYAMLENNPDTREAISRVAEVIRRRHPNIAADLGPRGNDDQILVFSFNDSKEITADQIVAVFEEAAALELLDA